jgi:hypothetical protein
MNKLYFNIKVWKIHLGVTYNISLVYPTFSVLICISLSFIGVTFSYPHNIFHPKYKKHNQNIKTAWAKYRLFNIRGTGTSYLYFIEIQLRFLCSVVRCIKKLPSYWLPHSTRTHPLLFIVVTKTKVITLYSPSYSCVSNVNTYAVKQSE